MFIFILYSKRKENLIISIAFDNEILDVLIGFACTFYKTCTFNGLNCHKFPNKPSYINLQSLS